MVIALIYAVVCYLFLALPLYAMKNRTAMDYIVFILAPITAWHIVWKLAKYKAGRV